MRWDKLGIVILLVAAAFYAAGFSPVFGQNEQSGQRSMERQAAKQQGRGRQADQQLLDAYYQQYSTRVERHTYKKTPQGDLPIYVHFPKDWTAEDKRPAIVFFFGGGWTGGTVEQFARQAH